MSRLADVEVQPEATHKGISFNILFKVVKKSSIRIIIKKP